MFVLRRAAACAHGLRNCTCDTTTTTRYFEAVFSVIYANHPGMQHSMGIDATELAEATALQCFQEADSNNDGKLSFPEFQAWYSGAKVSAPLTLQDARLATYVPGSCGVRVRGLSHVGTRLPCVGATAIWSAMTSAWCWSDSRSWHGAKTWWSHRS